MAHCWLDCRAPVQLALLTPLHILPDLRCHARPVHPLSQEAEGAFDALVPHLVMELHEDIWAKGGREDQLLQWPVVEVLHFPIQHPIAKSETVVLSVSS